MTFKKPEELFLNTRKLPKRVQVVISDTDFQAL